MFYLIYNILSIILFPVYILIYFYRYLSGKDTISSIAGRLVFTSSPRSKGKLVWLHAASVGESMVALTLIEGLAKKHKDLNFLVTTGTISSAKIVTKWKSKNCYHQYTPNDNILIMNLFLSIIFILYFIFWIIFAI